jgi:hypothetical protein
VRSAKAGRSAISDAVNIDVGRPAAVHRPVNWLSFTVPQAQVTRATSRRSPSFGPAGPELYFALGPYYPAGQAAGTTAEQAARIDTFLEA